jgi:hypothetical protein
MNKVESLQKIALSIKAGTSQYVMDLTPKYPKIEFIFGLGPAGMTPFEYELADRAAGDSVSFHVNRKNFHSFFEHINPSVIDLFDGRNDVYLQVCIDAVTPAENKEVVKAMAEMAAHGGVGCDCGCGCGG